jgi:hypothetical protein
MQLTLARCDVPVIHFLSQKKSTVGGLVRTGIGQAKKRTIVNVKN